MFNIQKLEKYKGKKQDLYVTTFQCIHSVSAILNTVNDGERILLST